MTDNEKLDVEDLFSRRKKLREQNMKLSKRRGDKDIQKCSFPNRGINLWNALPQEVVCVNNIRKFKEKYDKWRLKDEILQA